MGIAVEQRTVDKILLFKIVAGRIICSLVSLILNHLFILISHPLNTLIKEHYTIHMFGVLAHLDVPTFDDPLVQRQLKQASSSRHSIVWNTVINATSIGSTAVMLVSQLSVLLHVLKDQQDGPLLAALSLSYFLFTRGFTKHSLHTRGKSLSQFRFGSAVN